MENKFAKIPVASHGLHKHDYNYPWLSSVNFGDVMPVYYNHLRKGERDNPHAGLYSQLMPIAHNAFATGRYNFKAVFVPFKLVWRPWYNFEQQTVFNSNNSRFTPTVYPYVSQAMLSRTFKNLFGVSNDGAVQANQDNYDIVYWSASATTYPNDAQFLFLTRSGRRVLRILGALGCTPSFNANDTTTLNILPLLCYIKAFTDYYFPNNYVGGVAWALLARFFDRDSVSFDSECTELLQALDTCSINFYENSIFDIAWDTPATPNSAFSTSQITIPDVTDPDNDIEDSVENAHISAGVPTMTSKTGSFSQYVVDALKSLSMWMKRRQLSGARLIDKFLVSRGVSLSNDSARISYLLGQRNIEIEVSGVENNTDTNLGELAGRGVASSGDSPISFDCRPDDDGIFIVIVSPLPDANFPVYVDGFTLRKDFLDNYTAEYDKLGATPVPTCVVQQGMNGFDNYAVDPDNESVFGFLNRYWDEVQEKPRLLGDFVLKHRGSEELQAYHTFRIFNRQNFSPLNPLHHSFNFQQMNDSDQYQRLFYSDKQENLMLFLRWYGSQYKEKLPLGDSYDWDDDEMNRKVSVIVGGSQK